MSKNRPRRPGRCPICFRIVGRSWPGLVMAWHKWNGRTCTGVGMYGEDA